MGTADKFVKMMGYSEYFGAAKAGTPVFSAKWIKAPKLFPNFGEDQHEFIKKTHYEPQLNHLKTNGINLKDKGPAVQDAIWSTSVQFGGATNLILKALAAAKLTDVASDQAIVSAIQDYKLNNNNVLFKSSSAAVRASTAKRARDEKKDLLALAASPPEVAQVPEQPTELERQAMNLVDDFIAAIVPEEQGRNG